MLYALLITHMTQEQLKQSIFQLASNHDVLLMPCSIQGNNPLVNVAIRFYGVKGRPTTQAIVNIDGVNYYQIIGQLQGTENVEQIKEGDKEGLRYAPVQGYLSNVEHLPTELHQYEGTSFPCPPELNISFLVSVDDVDMLEEESQQGIGAQTSEFQGKYQNSWVLKVEMNLYQAVTLLAPTNYGGDGFRFVPSILLTKPIELKMGENIIGYSQFGSKFPYSRLTTQEVTHPLVSYFLKLITENREYGIHQSIANGSRAYVDRRRNANLPTLNTSTPTERTATPTTPTNFFDSEEVIGTKLVTTVQSSSTSTPTPILQ